MSETATNGMSREADINKGSPKRLSLTSVVGRVVHAIDRVLSPGDVSELRRLKPSDASSPAFFKLMVSAIEPNMILPSGGRARDEIERRWAAVFQAAATLASFHQPRRPLGEALKSAGYSELRLTRLLRAQGDGLFNEVRTCAHFLASKAEPANLSDLAMLVLVTDTEKSESLRRNIARGYYRPQAQEKKES